MVHIKLTPYFINRMVAIHECAHDKTHTMAVLTGLSFRITDDKLHLAATDGKILAYEVAGKCELNGIPNLIGVDVIIPSDAIAYLKKLKTKTTVDLEFHDGKIKIVCNQMEATFHLIEGNYPYYQNAIDISSSKDRNVFGINPELVGRIAKLWPKSFTKCEWKRGLTFKPLNKSLFPHECIALIMDVDLAKYV